MDPRPVLPPPSHAAQAFAVAGALVFIGLAVVFVAKPFPTSVDVAFADTIDHLNAEGRFRWGNSATEVLIDYSLWAVVDAALVIALWRWASPQVGGGVAIAILGQEVVIRSMKSLVSRPRPDAAFSTSGAYPSGHVANATLTFLFALSLLLPILRARGVSSAGPRQDAGIVGALIVVYALYRAFTGEHWLTDVLGGVALALAWCGGTILVLRRVVDRQRG